MMKMVYFMDMPLEGFWRKMKLEEVYIRMKLLTYSHGSEYAVGVLKNDGSEVVPVNYLGFDVTDMNEFLEQQDEEKDTDIVVSSVGNGLSEGELMPVKYEYRDSGYSITTIERKIGKGKILVTSLLLGTKYKYEPIAKKILKNILNLNLH